jgi:hypothetical protein
MSIFKKMNIEKPANLQSILSIKIEEEKLFNDHKRKMKQALKDIRKKKYKNIHLDLLNVHYKDIHSDLLNEYFKPMRYEQKNFYYPKVNDFQWAGFVFQP